MSNQAIVPIEQRTVIFYDDELTAVVVDVDGRQLVYVPIRPMCSFLGVSWDPQRRRINRNPVLFDEMMSVTVTVTDIKPDSRRPKTSQMLCLPLEYINGFLFGINANRVKSEVKENLIRYQRECYHALADAFLTRSTETAVSSTEASLLQVREMGLSIARMAEEQIMFERRLATTEGRMNKAAVVVGDLTKRVSIIEQRMATAEAITDEQASQISQAVKAIALSSPEGNFGKIYGELYRKFGITSYKLLPARRFSESMAFLTEWYVSLKWYVSLTGSDDVSF